MSYLCAIVSTACLELIEPITVRAAGTDRRLMALLVKPTRLTKEEWAYLEAAERAAA